MGKKELKTRAIWQDRSGANAALAEMGFYSVFLKNFDGTNYRIRSKPKEFQNIYTTVVLPAEVSVEIHNPEDVINRHGISPDYAIDNLTTKKTLYVEVKRQDGWVEGGKRSDGRVNAHERSCKYFTPGLLSAMREKSGIGGDALPFWTVFIGDITRDPCRVREITLWYTGCENHFFFWRDTNNETSLVSHFNNKLKYLLD